VERGSILTVGPGRQ